MTSNQAKNFIEQVLQGLWPRWIPKDFETQSLLRRLAYYDFERAKMVVENLFYSDTKERRIEPPIGQIFKRLNDSAKLKEGRIALFYEIFDQNCSRRNFKFFGNLSPFGGFPPHERIAEEAEQKRRWYSGRYKSNFIIQYHDALPTEKVAATAEKPVEQDDIPF